MVFIPKTRRSWFRWGGSVSFAVFLSLNLWARAGGGDGYLGDSVGGSFGGEAFETSVPLFLILELIFDHPLVGIPVGVAVVFFLVWTARRVRDRRFNQIITRGVQKQARDRLQEVFKKIKQSDPLFDPASLEKRVRNAFFKVQDSWSLKNTEAVRPFVSDGVLESWLIQFEFHRSQHIQNRIVDLRVHRCEIVGAEKTDVFETVFVKIEALGRDQWTDTRTQKNIDGTTGAVAFTEYWTFLRRPGARTKVSGGALEGQCPNCGGALVINDKARCGACDSLIASGEFDWTLTAITQDVEWRFRENRQEVPGAAVFLVNDPAFNIPFVEERAMVVFWRLQKALLDGNSFALRKVALSEFCDIFDKGLVPLKKHGSLSVGVCQTVNVSSGDLLDTIGVLVKWEGVPWTEEGGGISREVGKKFFSCVLKLVRKKGTKTDQRTGFLSLHCPGCGAPEVSSLQSVCDHCGLPLADGSRDWVLADVVFEDPVSPSLSVHPSPPLLQDPVGLLSSLVLVVMADGEMAPKEQKMLEEFASLWRMPEGRVRDVVSACREGTLTSSIPVGQPESHRWLESLADMCLVDGTVDPRERALLITVGKSMGYTPTDVDLYLRRRRTQLYARSRAHLKSGPAS